jgi:hypothetical protein
MARVAVGAGILLCAIGGIAILCDAAFNCTEHTAFCTTWSVLGLLGSALFFVGLVVAFLGYRQGRSSVPDWADQLGRDQPAPSDEAAPSAPGEPRGPT